MSRVNVLSKADIDSSSMYLFEGGMAREHRTVNHDRLTHKIRLSCLFTSRILVHSGNLMVEEAMFDAVKADPWLLEQGRIVPVLRGASDTLEKFGAVYGEKFMRRDPTEPAFYQIRPVTRKNIADIESRIDYFRDVKYSALIMPPLDRASFQDHFLADVEQILAAEPELDLEIKEAIRVRAEASSSPLGKIRYDVLRVHWRDPDFGQIIRRIARRINISYYGSGARELDTWFSMSNPAFQDLKQAPMGRGMDVSELVELSVSRALEIPAEVLLEIQPDDFATIVNSVEASKFRIEVERTISNLARNLTSGIELHDTAMARVALQQKIDDDFRDTFATSFAQAIRRRRRIETRRMKWGIRGGLIGLGVATDFLTGGMATSLPVGTAVGVTLSAIADSQVKPRIAPVIMLQDRIRAAADRR